MINCIQSRNPGAGFHEGHHVSCLYCEEDAECHFNTGSACGNVCREHIKKFRQWHAVCEEGIYVIENHYQRNRSEHS